MRRLLVVVVLAAIASRGMNVRAAEPAKPDFAREVLPILSNKCFACHGPDAKGNQLLGAPNLTDTIWLHGSSAGAIKDTITNGRTNKMPAHNVFLGNDKSHLLAAYIYSLSN